MPESVTLLPDAESLEVTYHGEARAVFEPTAARSTCTTAPCCCCCN